VIDPWNSRDAQREMGQPGTQRCVTELSGNGTTPPFGNPPVVVFKLGRGGVPFALGTPRSTQPPISLLTRTLPLAPEVGTA
jgi:hypothetical protein